MDRSHGSGGGLGGGQPQSRGSEGQRMEVMPVLRGPNESERGCLLPLLKVP